MVKKSLLVAGTDTNVGKTVLTSALISYWQTYYLSRSLGVFKPMQTGIGDREFYHQYFALNQSIDEINPLHFEAPLAPPIAAELEGKTVDLKLVWSQFCQLQQSRDFVLVEGLGGLGSPITHELTVADLARDWHLPTILVVPVRLGAIAQAVANAALARQMGVLLQGLVLNCVEPCSPEEIKNWTPIDLIESLTQIPILGILPYINTLTDREKLAQIASNLDLETIFS
ncbi:ATP-dependent dethiobiotin synthetase BioD [Planktothrix tepida]|uniref:ATP-dependent dethiobiotin synthetase BioD n=2 Tax=Planktothrix TaxID=54304 RepID=A0A1J1LN49_9CYAN|nr:MULTISPECIES: dethiobiotin synthase [Planktothrix]CAD5949581.1 ATP-dependent dethiobiotin synthetase BioD [Planktothrix pseudagardhii]CAD5960756.1 ATP-dependent dethiobiotin synthetase BioD [Planktothrix tepida]CUR33976.1 ATP-dependent dethiobiotin synthetase BioD [Planktothrix tepida PCC 9214]